MTVDTLLAATRAEVLAVACDVIARGPGYAALVSLDGEDRPVVDVLPLASIAWIIGLSLDDTIAMARLESAPLSRRTIRVIGLVADPMSWECRRVDVEEAKAA